MAESVGELRAEFTISLSPLQRGLRQASSLLQAWAKKHEDDTNAEIDVDLDPLKAGLRDASRLLKQFDGSKATAKLELDTSAFSGKLRDAGRDLSRFDGRKAEASVTADTSSATRSFNDLRRQLSDLSRQSDSLTVDADVRPARSEIQGLVRWAGSQSASVKAGAATQDARGSVNSLLRWIGSQSASIKVGADTSDARNTLNSLLRQIAARKANISIGAVTSEANRAANALKQRIEAMQAAMRVSANTGPARSRVQAFRASTQNMAASVRVGANLEEARKSVEDFLEWVRKQSADVQIGAVTTSAQRSAEVAKAYIDNLSANIDVNAATGGAMANARQAASRIDNMSADIGVGSDTGGVMPPVQSVVSRVNASRGDVRVGANTDPARNELNGFNQIVRRYSNSWGQQGLRVRVQSDTQQVQAQLRNLQRLANQVTDPEYRLRIDAQTALAQGKLRALSAQATALGLRSPTISVGMRGVASTTAQMLGLNALADRLDGYNIRFNASVDQTLSQAMPQMLGALEQQIGRLRIVMQTAAAVTVPAYYAALGMLPGAMAAAGTAAGALATRLGAGLVGAIGSVGSAAVLGAGALGTYGYALTRTLRYGFQLSSMLGDQKGRIDDAKDATKQAQAAVDAATPGTREYTNAVRGLAFAKQNEAFETRKMNAMMQYATPEMLRMNAAANDMQIEFIGLGAAMSNAIAPTLTNWIRGLTGVMQDSRGAIVGMVTDMNRVADSFVNTMSKGREFANLSNIFSGIRQAGVPAMQILTSAIRLFVNTFAATVPAGLKVLNMLSRVTMAAAEWSGTAAGQSKIRTVWQSLAQAGAQLGRIVRDLAIGLGGVILALNQTGIGQSMMNGLEGLAAGFRKVMAEGGRGRAAIVEFGAYTTPVLSAIWDLVKGVAEQFGLMAMEVGKSGLMVDIVNAFNDALLGTKNGQGIIKLLRHEFEVIGPLLPPLIRELGNWFSTFAQAEVEMKLFIKFFTQILAAFNSLPEPVKRGVVRMMAWGMAIKTLTGGAGLGGLVSTMVTTKLQMAMLSQATGTQITMWSTLKTVVGGTVASIKTASLALWGYTKAAGAAALSAGRIAARNTAAAASWVAHRIAMVATTAATKAMTVAQRALNLAMRMNPIGLVITALALAAVGLVVLYRRSETFRNIVNGLWAALRRFASSGLNFARDNIWAVGAAMMTVARGPSRNLRTAITATSRSFSLLGAGARASVRTSSASLRLLPKAVMGISGAVRVAATAVGRAFMVIVRFFRAPVAQSRVIIMGIARAVRALIAPVRIAATAAGRAFMIIVRFFRMPVTQVRAVVMGVPRAVRALIAPVRAAATAAGRAFAVIVRFFRQPATQVRAVVRGVPRAVQTIIGPIRAGATRAGRAFMVIVRFFRQPVAQVRGVVRGVPRAVQTITSPVRQSATRAGRAFAVIVRFFMTPVNRVRAVLGGFTRFIGTWAGRIGSAIARVRAVVGRIVGFFRGPINRVRQILSGVAGFIGGWVGRIGSFFGRVGSAVMKVARPFMRYLGGNGIIPKILRVFLRVATKFLGPVGLILLVADVAVTVVRHWDKIKAAFNASKRWLAGVFRAFKRFAGNVGESIANFARNAKRRWDDFWSGVRKLWDRSLSAIRTRTDSWRTALRNLFNRFAKWIRGRWDDFWSGLKGLWDRSLTAVGKRTRTWRDALRNLFDRIAKWARGRWDDFWSGMRGLWDRAFSAIGDRARTWGDAIKDIFQRVKGWMTAPMEAARDTLKGIWNTILGGISKVLGAVGLKKAAGKLNAAKWAAGGTTQDDNGQAFAKGGTTTGFRAFASGGMGTSSRQPRVHMWNEQMGNEAYITERGDSRTQMRYLSTAANWHNASVVPKAGGSLRSSQDYATGGIATQAFKEGGYPSAPRGTNPWGGTSTPGVGRGRTTWNWTPQVKGWIDEITAEAGRGTAVNTYKGHPGGEQNSVDWWGPRGRGHQIPRNAGGRILKYIKANIPHKYTIWLGRHSSLSGGGHGHFDHLHATLGAGAGGGGPSWQERAFNFAWGKFVDPVMNRLGNRIDNGMVLRSGAFGAAKMTVGALKDWIWEQIPKGGGGGSGGKLVHGKAGTIGEALTKGGWPKNQMVPASSTVWHESRGDSKARNPSGARGLMQIMPNTAKGVGADYGKLDDPVYNTSAGLKVFNQAGGWGPWVGAGRGGDYRSKPVYRRGGVIPGSGPKAIMAHGGERVLSADLNSGFEALAASVDSWNSRGAAAPSVDVGGSNLESRLSNVESLLEDIRDNGLSTYERNWSEGERTMLASQASKGGKEIQRRNADAEYERKLARRS